MATLIKNGTLITASDTYDADILIENEKISLIGKDLHHPSAEVIEAAGKLVMPGGIDPHVHLDLPMFGTVSSDDHYTGHKAAAFGGTTTVMDFVVLEDEGFQHSVDIWMKMAQKAAIDYSFHMNLTRFDEKLAKEIPLLREMGITTLKVFTAYNGRLRLDDALAHTPCFVGGRLGHRIAFLAGGRKRSRCMCEALKAHRKNRQKQQLLFHDDTPSLVRAPGIKGA